MQSGMPPAGKDDPVGGADRRGSAVITTAACGATVRERLLHRAEVSHP